jgi:16S rRNA (cytosine1407-C5)-methyltransferase
MAGSLRVDMASGQGFYMAALTRPAGEVAGEVAGSADKTFVPPGEELDIEALDTDGLDMAWGNLPDGRLFDFRGRVHFLPARGLELPARFRWRGLALGRMHKDRFTPAPMARILLGPAGPGDLVVDEAADLRRLVAGLSMERPGTGRGLYYKDLPLGFVARKGRRLLWQGRP